MCQVFRERRPVQWDRPARARVVSSLGSETTRCRGIGLGRQTAIFGQSLLSLLGLHAIEHQHSVQMIELVLKKSRFEFVGFERHLVAVDVDSGHQDGLRANHFDIETRNAETALLVRPFTIGLGDHRVEDDLWLAVDVPDEDLTSDSDLRRCETDSRFGFVQSLEHLVDDSDHLAVDVGDFGRLGRQHWIAECPDFVRHTCQANCEMSHYFDQSPDTPSDRRPVTVVLPDDAFEMWTDRGVFSHGRLDTGTKFLLTDAPSLPDRGTFLDLGCGAGPISLILARRRPGAHVIAVDVNERARELTADNARRLEVTNIDVKAPDDVDDSLRFDVIWSNPPIKVGKEELHAMLVRWLDRLTPSGNAILVVQKNLGSDSLQRWLIAEGFPTTRLGSRAGYRLLEVAPRHSH